VTAPPCAAEGDYPERAMALPERADTIVIGGGHNGLTCAAYLARAGRDVLVLEARDEPGGCASTVDAIGARVNICNCDHAMVLASGIIEDLDLPAYGLRYLQVDPAREPAKPPEANFGIRLLRRDVIRLPLLRSHIPKKILVEKRAHRTLFYHQEKVSRIFNITAVHFAVENTNLPGLCAAGAAPHR
jgi:hypothetical protein